MENSEKTLLVTLLEKCINDPKSYIPFTHTGNSASLSLDRVSDYFNEMERIQRSCRKNKILTQNYLQAVSINTENIFLYSLQARFRDAPLLILNRKKRQKAVERYSETIPYKNLFGKVRQEKMDVIVHKCEFYYILSHGSIECELTDEEGNFFIEKFQSIKKKKDREEDLEKLKKRIEDYSNNNK